MSQTNETPENFNSAFYNLFFSEGIVKIKDKSEEALPPISSVLVLFPGSFGLSGPEEITYKSIVAATKAPSDIFRTKLCKIGEEFDMDAEPEYSLILSFGVLKPITAFAEEKGNSLVISTYSISDLVVDSGKKKMLWGALKQVFGL